MAGMWVVDENVCVRLPVGDRGSSAKFSQGRWLRRGAAVLAVAAAVLTAGACASPQAQVEAQPELPPGFLAAVLAVALAMVASLGTGAWLATNKVRGGVWVGGPGRVRRWPWSLTAVVLALVVWPLVLIGSGWTMATWTTTHTEYDGAGMVLG